MEALRQVGSWPAPTVAVAVLRGGEETGARGDRDRVFRWASVTKLVTALATLVAAEEGAIDLDEPAGPEGSTVRHLLAHASGLPFEPGCLRFFENERAVRTASSEQVRQPIYREGLEQWRHFEPWLGPLKAALADARPASAGP